MSCPTRTNLSHISAGRKYMVLSTLVLIAIHLVVQVDGVPITPDHVLHTRHHVRNRRGANAASTPQEPPPSQSDKNDVMSPKNDFFPFMIVILAFVGLTLIGVLAIILYRTCLKHKLVKTSVHASKTSSSEKFGHMRPAEIRQPPKVYPVMSSVPRGTRARYSPQFDAPQYSFLDMNDDSLVTPGVSNSDALNGHEKSDGFSLNDGESAFSIDVKDSNDAQSLRQCDLSKPCVTHGSPEWVIQAYEEIPEDERQSR